VYQPFQLLINQPFYERIVPGLSFRDPVRPFFYQTNRYKTTVPRPPLILIPFESLLLSSALSRGGSTPFLAMTTFDFIWFYQLPKNFPGPPFFLPFWFLSPGLLALLTARCFPRSAFNGFLFWLIAQPPGPRPSNFYRPAS